MEASLLETLRLFSLNECYSRGKICFKNGKSVKILCLHAFGGNIFRIIKRKFLYAVQVLPGHAPANLAQ